MTKVILNKDFGGFQVSAKAHKMYAEKLGKELFYYVGEYNHDMSKSDEDGESEYKPFVVYTRVSYEEFLKKNTLLYFYSFKDLGEVVSRDIIREDADSWLDLDHNHREDPLLVEIVEELGEEASGYAGTLKVVEIPDELANGNYMIDDYDGWETLHQKVEEY